MGEVKGIGKAKQKLTVQSMHPHIGQFITAEWLMIEFRTVGAEYREGGRNELRGRDGTSLRVYYDVRDSDCRP
jgi:hypothetical protein